MAVMAISMFIKVSFLSLFTRSWCF
jgi:hypothetical protein